ncbi:MAG: hypothetical protein WKG07_01065 [Hymenobacter sp.]
MVLAALKDKFHGLREAAIEGLEAGRQGRGQSRRPILRQLAATDPDTHVRPPPWWPWAS